MLIRVVGVAVDPVRTPGGKIVLAALTMFTLISALILTVGAGILTVAFTAVAPTVTFCPALTDGAGIVATALRAAGVAVPPVRTLGAGTDA